MVQTANPSRLLIVDDEEEVRKPLRIILTKAGYDVSEAADGEAAIQMIHNGGTRAPLNTILCDLRMERGSGVEVISYVFQHYPSIPTVVITGYPDVKMAVTLLKWGVHDYLVKPVAKNDLLPAVERAIRQQALLDIPTSDPHAAMLAWGRKLNIAVQCAYGEMGPGSARGDPARRVSREAFSLMSFLGDVP
jgi:two-component system chemotaxis response regulator CheY